MAFYKDMKGKTRQEKRADAFARGGFEDEGSGYGKGRGKGGNSFGKPAYGRKSENGRSFGKSNEGRGKGNFDSRSNFTKGDKHRRDEQPRSAGYRDNAVRRTPTGERAPVEKGAPRFQKKSNDYRFVTPAPGAYTERGDRTAPRPYDEQRRARQEEGFDRYRGAAPAQYGNVYDDDGDPVPPENLLSGRNPIREALKSGRDIEKLLVARGELSGSAREIVQIARERRIPVQEVDRVRLDAITHNHQGMLAFASAYRYSTVEAMLALAQERGEAPFLVLLDGITDPHNLGAIIRTAECAGAHGVIVQERRAVGLTPAAVKASAGAVEYLPVARVTNLSNTIEMLKAQNIWVYAADMHGEDYSKVDMSGAVALVIGAEGEGVSRRVLDTCDKTVSLPIRGKLDSLNASVAAGVLMYAAMRTR